MLPETLIDRAATAGIRLTLSREFQRLRLAYNGCPEEDLLRLIEEHEREITETLRARASNGHR